MLIVLRLDYFLNPPSQIEMMNILVNMWDDYCSNYETVKKYNAKT